MSAEVEACPEHGPDCDYPCMVALPRPEAETVMRCFTDADLAARDAARDAALRESLAVEVEARCTDRPENLVYAPANHAYADAARIIRGAAQ